MRGGKEEQLLMTLAQTDAERAAGPEAEQRLHRLVAVPARVLPGVEEGQDALDAIRRLPDEKTGDGRGGADNGE